MVKIINNMDRAYQLMEWVYGGNRDSIFYGLKRVKHDDMVNRVHQLIEESEANDDLELSLIARDLSWEVYNGQRRTILYMRADYNFQRLMYVNGHANYYKKLREHYDGKIDHSEWHHDLYRY